MEVFCCYFSCLFCTLTRCSFLMLQLAYLVANRMTRRVSGRSQPFAHPLPSLSAILFRRVSLYEKPLLHWHVCLSSISLWGAFDAHLSSQTHPVLQHSYTAFFFFMGGEFCVCVRACACIQSVITSNESSLALHVTALMLMFGF